MTHGRGECSIATFFHEVLDAYVILAGTITLCMSVLISMTFPRTPRDGRHHWQKREPLIVWSTIIQRRCFTAIQQVCMPTIIMLCWMPGHRAPDAETVAAIDQSGQHCRTQTTYYAYTSTRTKARNGSVRTSSGRKRHLIVFY